jgi:hypothetical protein
MLQSNYNANAFASTFAFFTTLKPLLKKAKELASHRTTNRKDSANLTQTTFVDREARTGNSGFKKLAVQWLNEALCFVSSSVVADSIVLRNRQLLVAAKRYSQW